MTTYNTGNAIGSTSPKDLYDNAENLDVLMLDKDKLSHPDRLGVDRWTWHGMESQFESDQADREQRFNEALASTGYDFIGDYAPTAGIEVTEYNQVLRDSSGALWRLTTTTPLPYTTTGAGMPEGGAFLAIDQDTELRNDLSDPAQGGQIVHVRTGTGEQDLRGALLRRNIWTSSIVGLRGIDTSQVFNGQKISISSSGRAGSFVWDSSDRSTAVSSDPLQGVFVPPSSDTSGASGAWIRQDPVLTPEMYGASGDGVTDDSSALAEFFSSGRNGRCTPTANYLFTEQILFDKPGVSLTTGGATFTYGGPESTAPIVQVQGAAEDWTIDRLNIHVSIGSLVYKVIDIYGDGFRCSEMKITSDVQQNNRSANVDAAFRVFGNNVKVESLVIESFDNGIRWIGSGGSLPNLNITSYVRGVWLDACNNLSFGNWLITQGSPDSSMSPGHNGVLFDDASDITGREIRVEGAGEHGVRFSGSNSGTDRVNIDNIITRNTGGCGVKFRCSSTQTNDDINIGKISCEDCGADRDGPVTNQEGLLLERVRRLWIGHFSIRRRSRPTSCHNAIAFTDAQIVTIDSVKIEYCNREAFYFGTIDRDDGGNLIYRDINDVYINGGMVMNPGRHGIFLDMDSGALRNINITAKMRSISESNAALIAFSENHGRVASDSMFSLDWTTAGSPSVGAIRGSGINANIIVNAAGDNFNGPAATCKDGSSWLITNSGDRRVRSTNGDWINVI